MMQPPEGGERRPRTRGRPSIATAEEIDREILRAAKEQFFQHGYERTSMSMIVKSAGVSKTTLYARYATKVELFLATVQDAHQGVEEIAAALVSSRDMGLEEGLIAFGLQLHKIGAEVNWKEFERLIFAEGPHFPELYKAVALRMDEGVEAISEYIMHCATREGIACRDPRKPAAMYLYALRGFYNWQMLNGQRATHEEAAEFFRNLVDTLISSRVDW